MLKLEKKNWHKRLAALGAEDYPGVSAIIETRILDLERRIAQERRGLERCNADVQ